jgi:hypothetical protein
MRAGCTPTRLRYRDAVIAEHKFICSLIGINSTSEGKKPEPRQRCQGLCWPVWSGRWRRGTPGRKNPLPVRNLRRGCPHTRRIGATNPHGALSSREAYPSQRSSGKGYCHPDNPAINSGPSDPLLLNIVSPPGPLVKRLTSRQRHDRPDPIAGLAGRLALAQPSRGLAGALRRWHARSAGERLRMRERWIRAFSPTGPAALWDPG